MLTRQEVNKNGRIIIICVAVFWVIFLARAAQVQLLDGRKFRDYADSQHKSTMPLAARRGTIFDCKGRPLAYDIEAKSYTVNPKYMKKPSLEAERLSRITGKPKSYWMGQFSKHSGYLMAARRVSQDMAYQFDNSGIETLKLRIETQRTYPYGLLASEVIGRTDGDNQGISGLEMQYDAILSGVDGQSIYLRDAYNREVTAWEHTLTPPQNGSDIYLALDLNLQEIVEDELQTKLDSCQAKWATAVFLDTESGGILACATLENNKGQFRRNRAIADMNEPGSTAKLIPLATAFENRLFDPDDIIDVEHGRYAVGGHIIRDDHPHDLLKCTEVGVYSSNIGAAKIGLVAGADRIYSSLLKFGFGARTGIDFPGEAAGALYKPDIWTTHNLAIICFGYGFSASALQVALAYGVVATGGDLLRPYFAEKMITADSTERVLNSKTIVRRVLGENTVEILDSIFRDVVLIGTAKKAVDDMCVIAGKTGTALRTKSDGRGYEKGKALASFAGYFPAYNPKVVGIIMYDSPHGSIYGGEISAPVFKNIAKRFSTLPGNSMLVDYHPRKEAGEQLAKAGGEVKILKLAQKRPVKKAALSSKKEIKDGFRDFTGLTMRDALRQARSLGIECRISGSGLVISQNPAPGQDTSGVTIVELIGDAQ